MRYFFFNFQLLATVWNVFLLLNCVDCVKRVVLVRHLFVDVCSKCKADKGIVCSSLRRFLGAQQAWVNTAESAATDSAFVEGGMLAHERNVNVYSGQCSTFLNDEMKA